jgi:hypothetical protein
MKANNEFEGMRKEVIDTQWKVLPRFFLEGTEESHKIEERVVSAKPRFEPNTDRI